MIRMSGAYAEDTLIIADSGNNLQSNMEVRNEQLKNKRRQNQSNDERQYRFVS